MSVIPRPRPPEETPAWLADHLRIRDDLREHAARLMREAGVPEDMIRREIYGEA